LMLASSTLIQVSKMKSNLDTWISVLDANIKKIETELG